MKTVCIALTGKRIRLKLDLPARCSQATKNFTLPASVK